MAPGGIHPLKIVVRNVDIEATKGPLREHYAPYNPVRITVMRPEWPATWVVMHFSNPEDASRAIQDTNGAQLCGRILYVQPWFNSVAGRRNFEMTRRTALRYDRSGDGQVKDEVVPLPEANNGESVSTGVQGDNKLPETFSTLSLNENNSQKEENSNPPVTTTTPPPTESNPPQASLDSPGSASKSPMAPQNTPPIASTTPRASSTTPDSTSATHEALTSNKSKMTPPKPQQETPPEQAKEDASGTQPKEEASGIQPEETSGAQPSENNGRQPYQPPDYRLIPPADPSRYIRWRHCQNCYLCQLMARRGLGGP